MGSTDTVRNAGHIGSLRDSHRSYSCQLHAVRAARLALLLPQDQTTGARTNKRVSRTFGLPEGRNRMHGALNALVAASAAAASVRTRTPSKTWQTLRL